MGTEKLAARLKHWRKTRGLTQKELAGKAGVERGTVIRIEAGGNTEHATIVSLANALGVSEHDLLGKPVAVRGLQLSANAVAFAELFDDLVQLADQESLWTLARRFPRRTSEPPADAESPQTPPAGSPRTGRGTRGRGRTAREKKRH